MLIPILIAVVVILAVLVIVVAMRPPEFLVTRTGRVAVPPASVFPHVNELRKWDAWSPWAKLDPNAQNTFEGSAAGLGSAMKWSGNNKIGEGRMTITQSRPPELIQFKLEFFRPFKATNTAEFTFKPDGGVTVVTWSMSGRNNFVGKAMGLFIDCDKMVGSHFEKGLAHLKSVVESEVQSRAIH